LQLLPRASIFIRRRIAKGFFWRLNRIVENLKVKAVYRNKGNPKIVIAITEKDCIG